MEETTMKKILYTLITALMLISCQDDMMHSLPTTDEGLVTLNVSLQVPEMKKSGSRAFGETNLDYMAGCSLQMVVFDGNGYLREWLNPLEANALEGSIGISAINKDEANGEIDFNVTLSKAVNKRIIHFIVNSPTTSYEFGDEATLISSLSVALNDDGSGNDVYWQRVEFPNGIDDSDVTKVLMNRIPMIRNFAKITVTNNAEDFTYQGFSVVNVWNKGTVAPYKGDGVFAALNTNETMKDYMTITQDGYEGIWPSDAELVYDDPSKVGTTEHPLTTNVTTEGTTSLTPFYMYERRNTYVSEDIPATYLLIKGKYNGSDYWYKLDLVYDVDAEGDMVTSEEQEAVRKQYYNILRNFHYQISIDDVSGPGYGSPEAAANHAASNNLSGSIDIRDLTNISDAVNRLFVSYTDITLVDNGTVTVRYKYVPNSTTDSKSNADVSIIELTAGQGIDRMTKFERANTDDADGWRSVEVTFDGIPSNWDVITNTLSFNIDGLTREVDFNLRKKMYMIVECDPLKVPLGVKEEVAGNILIPVDITSEEDPYQFFPLEFLIEAENLTISPDVTKNINDIKLSPYEMPVESGTSIIPAKNRQTFRYKRTITNAEYQALPTKPVTVNYNGERISGNYKVIPCNFLTNTTVSASKVYAQNEYFTLIKEGFFVNEGTTIGMLTLTDGNIYGQNQQVKVSFTALSNGTYTITPTGMTAASGTSTSVTLNAGQEYEGTFLANDWGSDVSATVTLGTGQNAETSSASSNRNTLPMTATTSYNSGALPEGTVLKVYKTAASANSIASDYVFTVANEDLNNGTSVVISDIKSNDALYFAYEDNDYIYIASKTASELKAGTELVFTRIQKPLKMNVVYGDGTQYYGIGKTFTLTFTTNKTGTYKITNSNFNITEVTTADKTFGAEAGQSYTVNCTTTTWSDVASITIEYQDNAAGGTNPQTWTGKTRNVLKITATIDNNNSNAENYITNYDNGETEIKIRSANNDNNGTTTYGTITAEALRNGTAEITYSGLSATQDIYFRFTYWYQDRYGRWSQGTGSANSTPQNATGSGSLTVN